MPIRGRKSATLGRSGAVALLLTAVALVPRNADADPILDQFAIPSCCLSSGLAVIPAQSVAQTVTAGVAGVLTWVDVSIFQDPGTIGDVRLHLLRSPLDFNTSFFSVVIPLSTIPVESGRFVRVDVSRGGLLLRPGEEFVIGLSRREGGVGDQPWVLWNFADAYDRGTAWTTLTRGDTRLDVAFRTHVAPVPEPATLLLGGSGAIALGLRSAVRVRRGRRRPS